MMKGIYVMAAGFEGDGLVETALTLLKQMCTACKAIVTALSNIDLMAEGGNVSATIASTATTIATLLVVIELCTQAMGFHFDDINDAVRFAFKVVVYKIIIENSSKIVKGVYGMFIDSTAWSNVGSGFDTVQTSFNDTITAMNASYRQIKDHDWLLGFKSFLIGILLLAISIGISIILIKILASIAGLLFELAINIAIAPVPIATLVNSQARQIGIGFIKGFAGNCLTLTMYSLCFTIYGKITSDLSAAFVSVVPEGDTYKVFATLDDIMQRGYSLERIALVVAVNIADKNWDARLSSNNISWANEYLSDFPEEIKDKRSAYYITMHPGLLDMFTNAVKEKIEHQKESYSEKIDNVTDIADKIADAIDNGELEISKEENHQLKGSER